MPRETYSAQQARIEKEIDKLRKKAEALQLKRRKPVVASIIRSMREYQITPEEIVAAYGKPATRRGPGRKATVAAAPSKRPVAPKYRHPETGETWSGRGKRPRWLTAAEAAGATLDSFLIQ
ncbi:H-NS family nucleoid-associated regulatory protein [Bordetella flabilis]|uniref:DNA-binding protein n=1 Tax=Bordetella flabilis TaxID=463014 RepID=A0A193GBU2_9BORD|nr:H-NS histone family protein [Bordetella flabilis]ANN77295.1 DNA-binding protein [Bordetella flabilis]